MLKKAEGEKQQLDIVVEKLKAELDNNNKSNESIKGDLQVLQNKQTELETNLDAVTREKRQIDQERSNINDELEKNRKDTADKQQEIDDLLKNLGDSNSGTKVLTDKIKEITEQKMKLESKGKSLEDESKDKKKMHMIVRYNVELIWKE